MLTLPPLRWTTSPNYSSRNGRKVDLIVCHDCEGSYQGSIAWFAMARSQVSAHIVLRDDGLEATQMVAFGNNAWHACSFNRRSVGVEMAGYAAKGFKAPEWDAAAAIIAWLLKHYALPARWAEKGIGQGFCSHHDLGQAGGGHNDPTTDPKVWASFVDRVVAAYGQQIPDVWPATGNAVPQPAQLPAGYTPTTDPRDDEPEGSVSWAQARLNALGVAWPYLTVDGLEGRATERAIAAFQGVRGLDRDGILGPKTIAALVKQETPKCPK